MELKIKNDELILLDKEIFEANKMYSMAIASLNRIPNIYADKEFVKVCKELISRLKKIKTDDEFEKLVIKNSLYNLEAQRAYLEYFTEGNKENIDELISIVLGKDGLKGLIEEAKRLDYKSYWEYYLSYQEYTYKQIPSDDEATRENLRKLLNDLKKDIFEYGVKHFNLPKDYDFELILGQPYSQKTYFHPTTRRVEISPIDFFIFKDDGKIKINVAMVIQNLFHEVLGHGRHEANSSRLPMTIQDNSINTTVPPIHIHAEGVAQKTEFESIDFMKHFKEKYDIENDYINQRELSLKTKSATNVSAYYKYLKLKNLENKKFDIEKNFKKVLKNHGLYVLYSTSGISPLSMMGDAVYPTGLRYLSKILADLEKEIGKKKFEKNHSLINEAISTGMWNFRILPEFIRFFLRDKLKD